MHVRTFSDQVTMDKLGKLGQAAMRSHQGNER